MAKTKQEAPQKGKPQKGGGGKKGGGVKTADKANANLPKEPPRLKLVFRDQVVPAVRDEFKIANVHAAPTPVKISVNMGIGDGFHNKPRLERLVDHLTLLSGQKSIVTRARNSIAGFKIREGYPVGAKVTLRKDRMWYFLDKLISLAIPRIRDFRGVSPDSFDKAGNYSLGLAEQTLFPEVDADRIDHSDVHGMDVTVVFANSTPDMSRFILRQLGMPFRREEKGEQRRGA